MQKPVSVGLSILKDICLNEEVEIMKINFLISQELLRKF